MRANSTASTSIPTSPYSNSRAISDSVSTSPRLGPEGDADTIATITKEISLADAATMTIEDLLMDRKDFDPNRASLKASLLRKLGLEDAVFEQLDMDNSGCFNDGIWLVSDSEPTGFVLKLVPHRHTGRKSDREKYTELQQRCPKILTEFSLAFPIKILQLKDPSGIITKDLIVMREAPGMQLTQHLYYKFLSGRSAELLNIFEDFGKFMKSIHSNYRVNNKSMQHGDCQPSNVFYDDDSRIFTLVDVADFGFGPYLAEGGENDVQHFIDGLQTLTPWYGNSLIEDCAAFFRSGYRTRSLS
jgi:hypothetical protein